MRNGWLLAWMMLMAGAAQAADPVLSVMPPDLLVTKRAREAVSAHEPRLRAELKKAGLEYGAPVFVRIFKESRELELWLQAADGRYRRFRSYPICKMSGGLGPKTEKGDDQAPEGFYTVNAGWMHPRSRYHLAFNIGYPNAYDLANEYTGRAIMVHGECSSSGCFAMTDQKIEEIYTLAYAALTAGQDFFRVHVFPFRMTAANLKRHQGARWTAFWQNLKEGYDLFEKNGVPPNDYVMNARYHFEENTQVCEAAPACAGPLAAQTAQCKALAMNEAGALQSSHH